MQERTVTVRLLVPEDLDGQQAELMIEDSLSAAAKGERVNSFVYPDAARLGECTLIEVVADGYAGKGE